MKLTVVGTGLLGGAVAERLLGQDHEVTVWNRTRAKAESLRAHGATVADSPAQAISASPIIVTVLKDGPVTREVLLDDACRPHLKDRTVVQMGTIGVDEAKSFAAEFSQHGGRFLGAPVLGSTPEARAGELFLMAAGSRELFDELAGLLSDLSENPRYVGEVGKAAALKLALNQLLVGLVGSFSLSLAMVKEAEVPVDDFMEIVGSSSLHSPQFDKKLPRMEDRDFSDPHFPVSHLLKDIKLMLEQAENHGLGTQALQGFQEITERALEMGYVSVDYSAIYNAIHPPDDS